MKSILKFLIICFILTGCASPVKRYSEISFKIDKKEEIVKEKAKDLISAGQRLIEKGDVKTGLYAIKKGQTLLGTDLDSGSEILESKDITASIKLTFEEGKEIVEDVDELEEELKAETNDMAYDSIGKDAVEKYKFWLSMKLYGVLLTIIGAVGVYFYFKPSGLISGTFSAITSFFKK
jgi:hypothetical protein